MSKDKKQIANFLFEVGMLANTPRSGFYFLGSGKQSVAEHINRVCYIGYVLAMMEKDVDTGRIVQMCLFHDMLESRISDLNYVHQKYTARFEDKAGKDLCDNLPFGKEVEELLKEYHDRKTKESVLAKDADNIELLLSVKEQFDIGNTRAQEWLPSIAKRIKSKSAKQLIEAILETESDEWWFTDKDSKWWIDRDNQE